ncbi:MAG: sulfatase-like hydrolase/transferase [Planctomycetota bacterium]|jgi:arylsulfatase A-like enzyme/Tfp pilus assembly protein PilF
MKSLTTKLLYPTAWAACIFLSFFSGCRKQPDQAKHVILISMDTTRADHLSCYGFDKKTTPNLDDFSKDAVLYDRCLTPNARTLPAHSSMLTGTNPVYHGVHDNVDYVLDEDNVIVAEVLKQKGYQTGAVVSSFVLDAEFGMNQGFDTYDDTFQNPLQSYLGTERRGDEASQVACQWLEENRDEDFFLFLHYYDPHQPYQPPEPFLSQYKDNLYAGEIAYTDHCIKQVLDKLKQLDIYDDALIIITADHGEGRGDHGEVQHGYFIYQSCIQVPLMVHYPGGRFRKKTVSETVGTIDIVPTICRWTGVESPADCVGQDLTAYLENKPLETRFLYSESLAPTQYNCSSLLGLTGDRWKYIQSSAPEMYDLDNDPGETKNLIEPEAKRARLFQEELKIMLTEQIRTNPDHSDNTLDPESRAKLESLGYVAGGSIQEDFEFDTNKDIPADWLSTHQDLLLYKSYMNVRLFEAAEKACLKVMQERPDYALNYSYLAQARYDQGKYQGAVSAANEFFKRARQILESKSSDDNWQAESVERYTSLTHNILGLSYSNLKEYNKAIQQFEKSLEKASPTESAQILNNIGIVYRAQDNLDEASDYFSKALEYDPQSVEPQFNSGIVYEQKKEYEKALIAYQKALELKPDLIEAKTKYEQMQKILSQRAQVRKAIAQDESDLESKPENADLLNKLGSSYLFLGDVSKAVHYWERALAVESENASILNNLAYVYNQQTPLQTHDLNKALEYAQKACELTQYQNPNFLDTLASVHAARGEFDQAVDIAQQALNIAISSNQTPLAESIEKNIEHYQNKSLP